MMPNKPLATFVAVLWFSSLTHGQSPAPPTAPLPTTTASDPTERVLDAVELKGVPLRDALDRLRAQAGVNLFVSWNVLARAGVAAETPVDVKLANVTLGNVLDLVLADAAGGDGKVAWAADEEGVIRISTFADIERAALLRRDRDIWKDELRMQARLAQRIDDVSVERTPLWQAIDTIASRAGLKVVVPWRALESAGVGRSEPVTLTMVRPTAAAALSGVLASAGDGDVSLGYAVRGDAVEVSTYEGLRRASDTRVYDVSDLLEPQASPARGPGPATATTRAFGGAEEIRSWIQETIAPDSWRDNGGSAGAIRVLRGRFTGLLVVTQTHENHRELARVLSAVRGFLPDDPQKEPGIPDAGGR